MTGIIVLGLFSAVLVALAFLGIYKDEVCEWLDKHTPSEVKIRSRQR